MRIMQVLILVLVIALWFIIPAGMQQEYYRGLYDTCTWDITNSVEYKTGLILRGVIVIICNNFVESRQALDWFGEPSEGFTWPPEQREIVLPTPTPTPEPNYDGSV